jgi:uncharacterized membrane protein
MRELIVKWIRLDAQNYIPAVWIGVVVIWIGLVILGILSVRSQAFAAKTKTGWSLAILFVPFAGLFTYCCYCLTKIDYYALDFFLLRKRKKAGA